MTQGARIMGGIFLVVQLILLLDWFFAGNELLLGLEHGALILVPVTIGTLLACLAALVRAVQ